MSVCARGSHHQSCWESRERARGEAARRGGEARRITIRPGRCCESRSCRPWQGGIPGPSGRLREMGTGRHTHGAEAQWEAAKSTHLSHIRARGGMMRARQVRCKGTEACRARGSSACIARGARPRRRRGRAGSRGRCQRAATSVACAPIPTALRSSSGATPPQGWLARGCSSAWR